MIEDRESMVIQAMGSGRMHVASISPSDLFEQTVFGATGKFVGLPEVQVACGVRLDGNRGVVVMTSAHGICRACRHITGVTGVEDGELAHA